MPTYTKNRTDPLATEGLFRVPFGSEVGGDGLAHPVNATAVAIEELAYYSSSIAAVFDVHSPEHGQRVDVLECDEGPGPAGTLVGEL